MGYTHYYYVIDEYTKADFANIVKDFKKILPKLTLAMSEKPVQDHAVLQFNEDGSIKDETKIQEIQIQKDVLADGFGEQGTKPIINSNEITFNGVGELAHETFSLSRLRKKSEHDQKMTDEGNKYFEFTKTARKPYDLAVCSVLIIAKHYLKDNIAVHSDGSIDDEWIKPKKFVQDQLGYGQTFQLDRSDEN